MGNILFLSGFTFVSGFQRMLEFFGLYGSKALDRWKKRWRGLVTFIGGVCLVLCGYGVIGILIELFGILNLFGSFFPLVVSFLRSLPVVGPLLDLPGVRTAVDALSGKEISSMV